MLVMLVSADTASVLASIKVRHHRRQAIATLQPLGKGSVVCNVQQYWQTA